MKTINDFAIYQTASPHYQSLTHLPLTILVGLTGVGKTTTLSALEQAKAEFSLLPNRRIVADKISIATIQREQGEPIELVKDRVKRFEYTALYRQKYLGGMAHALSQISVVTAKLTGELIFDGLRGMAEIEQAIAYFPHAKFVVLDAPDLVRLSRLLTRGDTFDIVENSTSQVTTALFKNLQAISQVELVFDENQLSQIANLTDKGLEAGNIIKKTTIIVEERRNYDSQAAKAYLNQHLPPQRVLMVDTSIRPPAEVAKQIKEFIG